MSDPSPVILYPQVTRKGLNELLNLPSGMKEAITHIGFGVARYRPTAEQTAARNEVLRVPVLDSIEIGENGVQFYAVADSWIGGMTPVYEIIFYMATGTPLAIHCNPDEAEAVLMKGRAEELYYTLILDAIPSDKLDVINTQRVFNPGVKEGMDALASTSIDHTLQLDTLKTRADKRDLRDIDHNAQLDALEKASGNTENRLAEAELSMYSQTLARRMLLTEIMQPGLVSMRSHGDKSDGYQVEFEVDHANFAVEGTHDHPDVLYKPGGNKAFTLGMPEIAVNLRELQHWRHVDPALITPKAGGGWLETEIIEAGDIPPAILAKATPAEQIAEAREWMRAFVNNDTSIRNFRPYCKAILLYAESWDQITQAADPSPSFRHTADSTNVQEVTEQAALYSGLGTKGVFENKNHAVTNILSGRMVTTAWRMLAKELGNLGNYSPENSLYLNFDPAIAERHALSEAEIEDTRYAHYGVRQTKGGEISYGSVRNQTLLGSWMRMVPGLSNGKKLLLELAEPNAGRYALHDPLEPSAELNAGFYINYASIPDDAVGRNVFRFGWKEPSKFIALTHHAEVMPFTDPYSGITHRWSEALPWEFVILGWWSNPLWNPWNIQWQQRNQIRGNGATAATAYTGWNEDHRGFLLPVELFDAASIRTDPADTGNGAKWVMCGDGVPRQFVAAGMRIFTLNVDGKRRRTRYPIMPLAHHGSPVYQWFRAERLKRERESWAVGAAIIDQTLKLEDLGNRLDALGNNLRSYVDGLHDENLRQEALLAATAIDLKLTQ